MSDTEFEAYRQQMLALKALKDEILKIAEKDQTAIPYTEEEKLDKISEAIHQYCAQQRTP